MVLKALMLAVFFGVMVGIGLYCRRNATDVDGFVLGTTLLFGKKASYKEIITSTREMNFDYLKKEKKVKCNSYMS